MERMLWTQKQDIGPGPTVYGSMVYDEARKVTLLLGNHSTTWQWDGESWVQVADMGPPANAAGSSVAYDSDRQRTVLLNGRNTWEWDGNNWTQIADTGPEGGFGTPMAYDRARERSLVFVRTAGPVPAGAGTTWEWDGSEWTQRDDTGPSRRTGSAMVYDIKRQRTVLFGGQQLDPLPQTLNDTWEWNGSIWKQIADMGPPGREESGMVYDSTRSKCVLFGGNSFDGGWTPTYFWLRDTWEWDGKRWVQRQDMGPAARSSAGMVYDRDRKRIVLFGGATGAGTAAAGTFGDTWEYYDHA